MPPGAFMPGANLAAIQPKPDGGSMLFFKTNEPLKHSPKEDSDTHAEKRDQNDEKWYVCRSCHQPITEPRYQIRIQGIHRHTFANPSGLVFEIGCFSSARGFTFIGPPSVEFTWFAGHSWRIVVCSACLAHLGWYFSSGPSGGFFGFIVDRLLLKNPSSE